MKTLHTTAPMTATRRENRTPRAVTFVAMALVGVASVGVAGCKNPVKPGLESNSSATASSAAASKTTGITTGKAVGLLPNKPASTAAETAKAVQGARLVGVGRYFTVHLFFSPKIPKVSQLFSLRTVVTRNRGALLVNADELTVDATMPAHGHGMMTRPQHSHSADGSWRTEGMKLHMHGDWVFAVTVGVGKKKESIRIKLKQPPEAL